MKFILGIQNLDLQFRVVEYRANLMPSLYRVYKQAKSTLLVLHTQAHYRKPENKSRDMRHLETFKPLLETIIVHVLLTTHHHVKIYQYNLA